MRGRDRATHAVRTRRRPGEPAAAGHAPAATAPPASRLARVLVTLLLFAAGAAAQEQIPPPPAPDQSVVIRGVVEGPAGPVGNIGVQARAAGGLGGAALTGPDGRFEIRVERPGAYRLTVHGPGFRPESDLVRLDAPGQTVETTIRLSASSLTVRVFREEALEPLSGVQLEIAPRGGAPAARGVTDKAGQVYFGQLKPGLYDVTARLAGFNPESRPVVITDAQDTAAETILLAKGPSIAIDKDKRKVFGTPQLPSATVAAVYQDGAGTVWFLTDQGVTQFDGANLESSDQDGALRGLRGLDVRSVAEADGAKWFATAQGLRRSAGGVVARVAGVPTDDVRSVAVDSEGALVVATADGLYRGSGDAFERIGNGEYASITSDPVDGAQWVAGGPVPGLYRLAAGRLEPSPAGDDQALRGQPVRAVLRTRAGELLLGNALGVFRARPDGVVESVFDAAPGPGVTSLAEDAQGNLWFGTERGAVVFDVRRRETDTAFGSGRVNMMATDREGNLWFATSQGAIRMDLYSFVPMGQVADRVGWIYPDQRAGRVWLVTAKGVHSTDGATHEEVTALAQTGRVNHLLRDAAGELWFATAEGVFREHRAAAPAPASQRPAAEDAGATAAPPFADQVSDVPAQWLAQTPDGRLWAATAEGVRVFNGKTFEPAPELAGYVASRLFVVGRDLWLATDRNAVCLRGGTAEVVDVSRGLEGEKVSGVTADASGRVWLATTYGVEVFDGETLRKIDNNGGIDSGEGALAVLTDRDGYVWVGLAGGRVRKIAFFDGGVMDTTYEPERLAVAGSVIAIAQDAAGAIWFGTDAGAVRHSPVRVAPTVSYGLEVDGRTLEGNVVPAGRHTIRFHFHGISMLGGLRYLVRLDGRGPWQLLPERAEVEREMTYETLPAGNHTLELRAVNRDLYGVGAPPVEIAIRIDVPVWRKPWFYGMGLVALLGLGAGAGLAYRYKTREYVLPEGLKSYVPIEPNPFIVGNPIRGERMFFGREDDFRYVRTKLEGASQGVVVVLCGERRAGKSSILYQILNGRLGPKFIPVFLDMQEMVVSNDREFFRRFARVIAEAVHIDRAEVDGYGFKDPSLNPYHQFVDFLDSVLSRIEDRTLLILVDEYELLEAKVEEGRLDPDIFLFLAGLMDSKERLSFIFTGTRRLEERDRRYWREMLRRSFFRKVGFLSPNDARRLVQEPVEGRVVYGRNVVDRVVRLTAGQPFYAQVVCQTAVDYLNEHARNAIGMRDIERVVAEIVDHPLPQMIYSWDALSPDEKVVLALLAEDLESVGDQGWSTAGDLGALVARLKAPVDLSENTIHLTLEELFRREVLEKNAIEGYRFRIDLLRLWIRRSHSIWQVLKER